MSGISRIKSPLNQALGLSEWGERLIIPGSMEDEVIETNQVFQPNAINGSKIESLTVNKLRAGSLNVDEYLQSTGYVAGSTGWRINGDGSVEFDSGYFRGDITGATGTFSGSITAGSIDIPDTTTANSFHVETDGDTFWGTTPALFTSNNDNATSYILKTGAARFSSVKITGLTSGSSLDGQYFLANSVASASAKLALRGWTQTCAFTVTDADTVAWGSGTLTASDGTAYSISSGNTGNMSAKTYVYLDTAVSTTAYQVTTTATTAIGDGKLLVAIAQNNTTEATFFLLNNNSYNIDAANIVAGSITANEIAASTITAGKMSVTDLSAISANIGAITSGSITVVNGGNTIGFTPAGSNAIFSGTTGSPEFKVTPAGALTATSATITGAITASSGSITGAFSVLAGLTIGSGGSLSSGQTNYDTGTGFWLDYNSGTPRFSLGNSAGNKLTWNGTSLAITGSLTATTGAIGGWTINSTSITDAAGVVGLSSAVTGGDDIRFWAGNVTPASAAFRVTEAGALTATSATISGAITATTGAIGGWTINSTSIYTGTEDHSGYTANAGDMTLYSNGSDASIHANKFYIDSSGVLNCTAAVISGAITTTSGSLLDGGYLDDGTVTSSKGSLAIVAWTQTCSFTVTDADTVAWASGSLTLSDGTVYSISGSNTGNMSAKTYIYFDLGISMTAYQTTTTAATAIGDNKILIAIAQNGTGEATFMLLNNNSYNIDAANIVAGSITANEIAANTITAAKIAAGTITATEIAASTITAGKLSVSTLSSITADLGAITAGTVTLNTTGYIRGGQTAYATGTGFFLGYDSSAYKFNVGSSTEYLDWNGTRLTVKGLLSIKGSFGGDGTDGALSISSGTTTIDCANAAVVTKNYTSISITGTGSLAFSNPHSGGTIIILKCQGNVTITSSATPNIDLRGMGGAGGAGGTGGASSTDGFDGTDANDIVDGSPHFGAKGLKGDDTTPTNGGAVYTSLGVYLNSANKLYRKSIIMSAGTGGGGGGAASSFMGSGAGGAGGRGGGGLIIECVGSLNFTGTIDSSGSNGVAGATGTNNGLGGTSAGGGGGGGGAAGNVIILYNSLTSNSGTIIKSGGNGGAGGDAGTSGIGGQGGGGAGNFNGLGGAGGKGGNNITSADVGSAGTGTSAGSGGTVNGAIRNGGGGGGGASTFSLVAENTVFI